MAPAKDLKEKDVELQSEGSSTSSETGKEEAAAAAQPKQRVSLLALFRFTTWTDRLLILIGGLAGLVHGMMNPLFILTFGNVIDSLSGTGSALSGSNDLIFNMIYIGIGTFLSASIRSSAFIYVSNNIANSVRNNYLKAVLRQEISWFDSKRSGELTARLANDIPKIRDATGEKVGEVFFALSMFVGGYVISFTKSWKVGLVVLAGTPALIICIAAVGSVLTMFSAKGTKIYSKAGSIAQEIITAIKTVIVFNGQAEEEKRYDEALEEVKKTNIRKSFVEALSTSIPFFIGFCLFALALWYGSTLVEAGELTAGRVFISFMCVIMGSGGLGIMAPAIITISIGRGAAFEVYNTIDRQSEVDSLAESGLKPDTCKGDIAFKDIKFSYPSRPGVQILKGVSFNVGAGKTVALVGMSGSGKSTIISLFERFYTPSHGSITLDGAPIDQLNVAWLRSRVGLVGQEPILFAGTIAENIAISKPGATMDEIVEAAKMANAHDFISQLSEGYNTTVFQRGGNLSGGQKQRIAIARALVKNPKILLLDEATSALDSKSELVVQQALENASVGRTTIVIAHRLSTIRNADQILVFNQGNILESGTHDELIAKNGDYARLVELQSISAKNEEKEKDKKKKKKSGDKDKDKKGSRREKKRRSGSRDLSQDDLSKEALAEPEAEEAEEAEEPEEAEAEAFQDYVAKEPKKQKTVSTWYILKKIFGNHYRHDWPLNFIGLIAGIGQGLVFPTVGFIITKVLIVLLSEQGDDLRTHVNQWSLGLVLLGLIAMIIIYIQSVSFLISGERFTKRLRSALFSNIIRQKGAWFDAKGHEPAVFETTLAQDSSLIHRASGRLLGQFVKILSLVGGSLGIGFYYNWKLALALTACVPLLAAGNYLKLKFIKGYGAETRKAYESSGVVAAEAIENIRTVISFTLEGHFLSKFANEILKPTKKINRTAIFGGLGFGYGEGIQYLVNAFSFWYGGQLAAALEISPEGMLMTVTAVINMGMIMGDTLHIFPDFQEAMQAAESYFELMVQQPEIVNNKPDGTIPAKCEGQITFQNVRFSYPNRPDIEILKGFSVSVNPGQTLAFVGHSGSGKSTNIAILERLYSFTSGNVLLDGNDIRNLDLAWLRSQMGYVGQEPTVFARSIRENITYGLKGEVTEERLNEAIRMANAQEFLGRLPEGLNTFVGERGAQLSGGQKQRIAIARALIRNPKILLLDEATSALDSESEKEVQLAINEARKGRTTIVIAHRLSTIKDADIIAVVDKGVVVEVGSHNDLLKLKGHYFKFVEAQSLEH